MYPVGFTHAPFQEIPFYRTFKISLRNRECRLNWIVLQDIRFQKNNFERIGQKRFAGGE